MIDFDPMSEQQINEMNLLPDGDYLADVFDAFDKDKNGKDLLTGTGVSKFDVILNVYTNEGKTKRINCVLTPAYMKLFKHFFDATNQQDSYNSGKIDINNVRGKKDFVVSIGKRTFLSNKSGQEMTVNNVVDFKSKNNMSASGGKVNTYQALTETHEFNDSIPF